MTGLYRAHAAGLVKLALAAAAAAVIAVAVTLVAVRHAPAGRPATPPPAAFASGVPEYYVALPPVPSLGFASVAADAVVGDTFTGKKVATVPAPKGWGFASVTAAGDDRTFVLGAQPQMSGHQPVPARWYLLRLTPGAGRPAALRQLPVPPQPFFGSAFSVALSPDGTMLATYPGDIPAGPGPPGTEPPVTELRVYSTATGALLHTWSVTSRELHGIGTLSLVSWTSEGNQLAFQTRTSTTGPVVVRLLPAGDPGHDLLAGSRPVVSFTTSLSSPHNCIDSFLVAGNGKTVVCGSAAQAGEPAGSAGGETCPAYTRPYNTAILQFSTVTGQLAGPLYQIGAACQAPGDLGVLWANDPGTAVLGFFVHHEKTRPGSHSGPMGKAIERFGLFARGKFTPLPAPLESDRGYPSITAW